MFRSTVPCAPSAAGTAHPGIIATHEWRGACPPETARARSLLEGNNLSRIPAVQLSPDMLRFMYYLQTNSSHMACMLQSGHCTCHNADHCQNLLHPLQYVMQYDGLAQVMEGLHARLQVALDDCSKLDEENRKLKETVTEHQQDDQHRLDSFLRLARRHGMAQPCTPPPATVPTCRVPIGAHHLQTLETYNLLLPGDPH
jgi:hypothetical protein